VHFMMVFLVRPADIRFVRARRAAILLADRC
jgi:hypothetical protein